MASETVRIEQSGNSVYAVLTDDGPAVYATLDDAIAAVEAGAVEVHEGDREYYEGRTWLPVEGRER
jgi:hypothetical protein